MNQCQQTMKIHNLENQKIKIRIILSQHELYLASSFSFFCKPEKSFEIDKNSSFDLQIFLNLFGKVIGVSHLLFRLEIEFSTPNKKIGVLKHYFLCRQKKILFFYFIFLFYFYFLLFFDFFIFIFIFYF